jgi:hypothetical protein
MEHIRRQSVHPMFLCEVVSLIPSVGSISLDEGDFVRAGGRLDSVRWSEEYGGNDRNGDKRLTLMRRRRIHGRRGGSSPNALLELPPNGSVRRLLQIHSTRVGRFKTHLPHSFRSVFMDM